MEIRFSGRTAVLALVVFLTSLSSAKAGIGDYTFKLIEGIATQREGAVVIVRLVDTRTGRNVPDAVIFATRLDMAPEGMASMTAAVEPVPSAEPGLYKFRTDLPMEGKWQLSLAAKIQGELGTLKSKLALKVVP